MEIKRKGTNNTCRVFLKRIEDRLVSIMNMSGERYGQIFHPNMNKAAQKRPSDFPS